MGNQNEEREILEWAKSLLKELYGEFAIDPCHTDKPDAAIILGTQSDVTDGATGVRIGIEITRVDKPGDLQYFNDTKIADKIINRQINDYLENGKFSTDPVKKVSIKFSRSYIADGLENKAKLHPVYASRGNFSELIVLAFSEHLSVGDPNFRSYHAPWANHLLSLSNFPFDKVIFACPRTKKCVLIYDKKDPSSVEPRIDDNVERGIERMTTGFLPMGQTFNLNKTFNAEPLIEKPTGKKGRTKPGTKRPRQK